MAMSEFITKVFYPCQQRSGRVVFAGFNGYSESRGVSYRQGIGDTRFSPAQVFVETLINLSVIGLKIDHPKKLNSMLK
jgi:hypothetical protein